MPITKSAKKALRQNLRRQARNLRQKRALKALVREFRDATSRKDKAGAQKMLPAVYKALDKAAKRGKVLKPNTASRLKSRLARALAKLG